MGWFFGYGSLVNHLTHDNRPLVPATVSGWRREWCLTTIRPVAFLSVRPADGAEIAGLMSQVPGGDWAALDQREYAYARHAVSVTPLAEGPSAAALYRVDDAYRAAEGQGIILMSYLDVVVEGFHHHFGVSGVASFFATTDGWDRPVQDDRAAPMYPRHRDVGAEVRALVHQHLDALGVEITG